MWGGLSWPQLIKATTVSFCLPHGPLKPLLDIGKGTKKVRIYLRSTPCRSWHWSPWRPRGSTPPNSLKSKARHCSFPGLLEQFPAEEGVCCALSNPFIRVQSCHGCNYIIRGENNSWRPNNDLFFKVTEPFHQNKAGVDNEYSSLCVFTIILMTLFSYRALLWFFHISNYKLHFFLDVLHW